MQSGHNHCRINCDFENPNSCSGLAYFDVGQLGPGESAQTIGYSLKPKKEIWKGMEGIFLNSCFNLSINAEKSGSLPTDIDDQYTLNPAFRWARATNAKVIMGWGRAQVGGLVKWGSGSGTSPTDIQTVKIDENSDETADIEWTKFIMDDFWNLYSSSNPGSGSDIAKLWVKAVKNTSEGYDGVSISWKNALGFGKTGPDDHYQLWGISSSDGNDVELIWEGNVQ